MNLLVIGNGGREHALAWKLSQSPRCERVYVAPGNAGTAIDAENVDIRADDFAALIRFARANDVALTIVGPESPLAGGIVDAFEAAGLPNWRGACGLIRFRRCSMALETADWRGHAPGGDRCRCRALRT